MPYCEDPSCDSPDCEVCNDSKNVPGDLADSRAKILTTTDEEGNTGYKVEFRVGNQGFSIGSDFAYDFEKYADERADFIARMFNIALKDVLAAAIERSKSVT